MAYADSIRTDNADFEDVAALLDDLNDYDEDVTLGWRLVDEAWTQASATTINVPTGATSRFQVGDKLKLDNTSTKYFVVTAVAASLLTVTGGSDYTVAAAAISNIYVSREEHPFGYPTSFNYSPTITGFSANPTNSVYRFRTHGRRVFLHVNQQTSGTSNATTFTISAPITAATVTNAIWGTVFYNAADNGANLTAPGRVFISSAGSTVTLDRDLAGAAWTNANGKRATFDMVYEF